MSTEHDALVEAIAVGIEEGSLLDFRGVLSKRKRDREDANLRYETRKEQQREIANYVRSFKVGRGNDPLIELERIQEDGGSKEYDRYIDIADLAARHWVDVEAVVGLTGNSIPSDAKFIAKINDLGTEALQRRAAEGKAP